MQIYDITIGGVATKVQYSDEEAKRLGLTQTASTDAPKTKVTTKPRTKAAAKKPAEPEPAPSTQE